MSGDHLLGDADRRWSVVVPVKRTEHAKTRLGGRLTVLRPVLALAFARDTVSAALAARCVDRVVVVTDDPNAADLLAAHGALVVPDTPDSGLNPALVHGARAAAQHDASTAVAALQSDLPALASGTLDRALRLASAHRQAFVPDRAGTGTTMYAAQAVADFSPIFGAGSREAHRRGGAAELDHLALDGLRSDVDTGEDLRHAVALGVGVHTSDVLAGLPGGF